MQEPSSIASVVLPMRTYNLLFVEVRGLQYPHNDAVGNLGFFESISSYGGKV